jgi:predicted helicase
MPIDPLNPINRPSASKAAVAGRRNPASTDRASKASAVNTSALNAAVKTPAIKFKPREDQDIAVAKVHEGFQKNDRGQLILPCGTGKTLTGLWIKEKEKAKTTIVAVPSIALIKQTKDSWEDQKTKDFDYLCICSDKDVDASADSVKVSAEELDKDSSKVTTDVNDIKKFLKKSNGDKVIYTTYQSLPKLMEAN